MIDLGFIENNTINFFKLNQDVYRYNKYDAITFQSDLTFTISPNSCSKTDGQFYVDRFIMHSNSLVYIDRLDNFTSDFNICVKPFNDAYIATISFNDELKKDTIIKINFNGYIIKNNNIQNSIINDNNNIYLQDFLKNLNIKEISEIEPANIHLAFDQIENYDAVKFNVKTRNNDKINNVIFADLITNISSNNDFNLELGEYLSKENIILHHIMLNYKPFLLFSSNDNNDVTYTCYIFSIKTRELLRKYNIMTDEFIFRTDGWIDKRF